MSTPIVLIPGFGGSLLYNKRKPYNYYFNHKVLSNKWANLYPLTFKYMKRWKNDMNLDFDISDNKIIGYKNFNRDIIPYDLYGIQGIQNLVPEFNYLKDNYKDMLEEAFHYQYYNALNKHLIHIDYKPKENLIGIPYDFRLILDPKIRDRLFRQIKHIIVKKYKEYNKKCIIISHSMGGILFKWFLSEYVDDKFVDNYIDKLILINTPFGGTPSSVKAVILGESYIPFTYSMFLEYTSKFSGILMTLPNHLCYNDNDVFLTFKDDNKNITLKTLKTSNHISFQAWRDLYLPYIETINKPISIDTKIIISNENQTPKHFYTKNQDTFPYKIEYDLNGDGLIPSKSLNYAKQIFKNNEMLYIKNSDHTGVLANDVVIENIEKWIT
jgi:hypothetical protein